MTSALAGVAELVYAVDLKSIPRKGLRVRVPPSALFFLTFRLKNTYWSHQVHLPEITEPGCELFIDVVYFQLNRSGLNG